MHISTWTKWTHAPPPQKMVGRLWSYRFLKSHSSDCKKKKFFTKYIMLHTFRLEILCSFRITLEKCLKINISISIFQHTFSPWNCYFESICQLLLPSMYVETLFLLVCVCVLYFFYNRFPFYFSNLMYDFVIFDVWFFNS